MVSKNRLELLKFSDHIGVFDPIAKKRLKDLFPIKMVKVRVKASAFEGGYNSYSTGDLHKKLKGKKTITRQQYSSLIKKYGDKK